MSRVLAITVGGSPEPIVNACREFEPDYVYFICSKGELPKGTEKMVDGPGDPCGDTRTKNCPECGTVVPLGNPHGKSIVVQAKILQGSYEKVVLEDPDDLEEMYAAMLKIHEDTLKRFPGASKAVNYTGGTKSMTAGAVLFALHYPDWLLAINRGPRVDAIKVTKGDTWWVVEAGNIHANMQVEVYRPLLKEYQYATVAELLKPVQNQAGLSKKTKGYIQRIRQLCQAFDAWDRFNHQEALNCLEVLGGGAGTWIKTCKEILGRLPRSNPYQQVADMVLNARRRVDQYRFDDAVARYYRAVEMLAQVRLQVEYGIMTGNVDLEKIPPQIRDEYAKLAEKEDTVKISLTKSYQLLTDLKDVLGDFYRTMKNPINDKLKIRNYSILAHGTEPVNAQKCDEIKEVLDDFVFKGLEMCGTKCDWRQLPGEELLKL